VVVVVERKGKGDETYEFCVNPDVGLITPSPQNQAPVARFDIARSREMAPTALVDPFVTLIERKSTELESEPDPLH